MGGGKGEECYTTGYRYYAGLHLVFCHALDKLLAIRVGDKWAWQGSVTANAAISVSAPDLFGGDDREGGIVGAVDCCFGGPAQARNSYLQSILGANIPAFRGLFGLIARHCQLSANNPYVKEWGILGQRTRTGWQESLADIVAADGYVDMNPAHIIREALTDSSWGGLGYPEADLDDASFAAAAYLLAAGADPNQDGLGLALLWARNSSIEDFIQIILNHIDGVLFYSHLSGLLSLKLIRNDYTPAMLPVLNESNIIELVDYAMPVATEVVNQVTVNWVDRNNQAQSSTVQDIAGITRAAGQLISATLEFPGIATEEMAQKVAARELQQLCVPIPSCTLVVNRKHWDLEPGDCFVFSWPSIGLADMVMRVVSIEIGQYTDSQLRIKAARDVYGLGPITITEPAESLWVNPLSEPADAVRRKLAEITWWQFVREYGESAAVLAELDDSSTQLTCFCGRPSADAINYEMWSRNVGAAEFVKRDTDSFPFAATTATALVPEISSVIQLQEGSIDANLVKVGTYAALGDELVAVTAIDLVNVTVTVDRGVLDTLPVSHGAGTFLWFHQSLHGLDRSERAAGEAVEVRILPSTSLGRLELELAATDTINCVGRMMRPYPPGNVQVNGLRWPVSIGAAAELVLSWAHRDRTLQTVTLNRQDEGNIGPESGVTYTLRIYGETGTLIRTVTGLTTTGYTYLMVDEQTDSGFVPARLNTSLRMELEAVRGSLTSLKMWNLFVTRV